MAAAAASKRSSSSTAEGAATAQQQQRHQPTNSKGQMTRASSDLLQFSLAVASTCHEDGLQSAADDQYEPVLELQRIQACLQLSPEEAKLAVAVEEAKAASVRTAGCVDLRVVGSILRSRHGYLVCVRRANASRRPKAYYLRRLRHVYLVVRGLAGDGSAAADSVLVDLNFRERFAIAHATPWYTKLLAALPVDWVGPAAGLVPLVGLMAAGMRLCFRQAGVPLPPWREGRAMLSMWVPEAHDDEALPLLLAPDAKLVRLLAPFHSPFRTAVREATGAPGGTSDGGTTSGPSQAAPGMQQHPAEPYSGSSRRLPPLPRAASGRVAQPGHITHHAHVTAPDVPRKIIMGFPVPSLPDQQLSSTVGLSQDVPAARPGSSSEASGAGSSSMQHPQQPQERSSVEVTTEAATGGGGGAPHASTTHLVEREPQQQQQHEQQQPQQQQRRPPPAFTGTAGVVMATAGGASPGIVINKKWLEQQLSGPSSPAVLSATPEHAPGLKAAAAGAPAAAPSAAAADPPAGGAKKPAASQFKSLEQLLPRMRTVRLGAA